jgi:hypothetical protein
MSPQEQHGLMLTIDKKKLMAPILEYGKLKCFLITSTPPPSQ